jgi:iron complex transport system substrate-binding protein
VSRSRSVLSIAVACATALLGACGDEPAASPTTEGTVAPFTSISATAPALPVTRTDATGTVVTVESIARIVPVDGDLAEIVFALGLGDHVVATDISATYPAAAEALPDIGYQRALNPEPIAAFEPTVVLATDLARPTETLDQLRLLGIPVVVIDPQKTLDAPAAKIQAVADALGVHAAGVALAARVTAEIDTAVADASGYANGPRVLPLYLRGENLQLILGRGTGIDVVLPAVGAVDVAAELGVVDTEPISAEALVLAAPDVLLVTTTGLESVGGIEGLLAIPGIAGTPAGRSGRVLAYEDQYLLGGGPRTGQMMSQLVADLHRQPSTTPDPPAPDTPAPDTQGQP